MFEELKADLEARKVILVAVSKTHPADRIAEIYQKGQRVFGENKVQELVAKYEALPKDIAWHLIGHLQRNKVKYIAPFVAMIQSVDSLELLLEIDRQANKHQRVVDCLLQFHIATEETKFGLDEQEAEALLQNPELARLQHIRICGVMGMASYSEDVTQVRQEFAQLRGIFGRLKTKYFAGEAYFQHISMGMSGDWPIAVEAGSTIVRIGSAIFGAR